MAGLRGLLIMGSVLIMAQGYPASALIGIGVHYGFDFTMKMDDKTMEQTDFSNLKFSLKGLTSLPNGYDTASILTGKDIPVYINRTGWKNTGINFGGKIYVNVLPFIDALEISTNFGVWQYDGSIMYPSSIAVNPNPSPNAKTFSDFASITYTTVPISLKNIYPNRFFWGVDQTPYAKLHFDATIRKYILQVPPIVKLLKIYGGAGMSVDFATPVLSSQLVEDAVGSSLSGSYTLDEMQTKIFNQQEIQQNHQPDHRQFDDASLRLPYRAGDHDQASPVSRRLLHRREIMIMFDKLDKYIDVGGSRLSHQCRRRAGVLRKKNTMKRLWAPWRMKYIKAIGGKTEGCIFCVKPKESDDRKNLIVMRGEHRFVILNAFPYSNGHLLIVPYMHTAELDDVSGPVSAELWRLTVLFEKRFEKNLQTRRIQRRDESGARGGGWHRTTPAYTYRAAMEWRYELHAPYERDAHYVGKS